MSCQEEYANLNKIGTHVQLNQAGISRNTILHPDARLRNPFTGEFVGIDQQPYVEHGCADTNIFTDEYTAKPRIYKSYEDIDLGTILYTVNDTNTMPFYNPAIDLYTDTYTQLYKTPSDVYWRETRRVPKFCDYNYINCHKAFMDSNIRRDDLITSYNSILDRHRYTTID